MRLHAICLVRDEDDVIAQSLAHAARWCEAIHVVDNGSTDGTWERVQALARSDPRIRPFVRTTQPYGDYLRVGPYNALHAGLGRDDWWLVLDADEFLAEDPGPVIARAAAEGADVIWAWQIQFQFTDVDLADWERGADSRARAVTERRRHYVIDWREPRLFRNAPGRPWDVGRSTKVPDGLGRRCSRLVMNRHYQFRDPPQIEARVRLRQGLPSFARHVPSADWRDYVRPARSLTRHEEGAPWRFTTGGRLYVWRRELERRLRRLAAARR
jgi:glycosyltransferase involved in cell wall biosynthesis